MKNSNYKLLIFIISLTTSLVLLVVLLNIYLKTSGKAKKPFFNDWMIAVVNFSPDLLFWSKSWCQQHHEYCLHEEEKQVSFPIEIYPKSIQQGSAVDCTRILFLGDSFTVAPWIQTGESYASIFSQKYAEKKSICVVNYRLATGGANNSQEFLAMKKIVADIKPDIVIWQFYWNDIVENAMNQVLTVHNFSLIERSSWNSMLFIAGLANQKIPFLRNTTLGDHLLYMSEQEDPFSYWLFDYQDMTKSIPFSRELIPLLFQEMTDVSRVNDFEWFTTLAPLECDYLSGFENCGYKNELQNEIRNILTNESNFVGMELSRTTFLNEESEQASNAASFSDFQAYFNTTEDKTEAGGRHLSKEGNAYFGSILFENFYIKSTNASY